MELSHGSLMVPQIPGTYFDEYQRKSTFEFLTILGWSYNEDNKIWYKSGIKNSDGSWVNVTETKRLRKSYITKKRKSFTAETLPKLKTQSKKITEQLLNQIMYEYFIDGIDLGNLSRKYGYDAQMLGYYTKKILQVEVYFDNYGNIYNK